MSRYTIIPSNTGGLTYIHDAHIGSVVATCGNPREAAKYARLLNRTPATHQSHTTRLTTALSTRAAAMLSFNKGAHPDILAARATAAEA